MFNDNQPTRFGGFIEMKDELLMDAPTLTERLAAEGAGGKTRVKLLNKPDPEACAIAAGMCYDAADALAYIQQLESRVAQVERERDAAVADLSDSCRHCRFVKEEDDSHCADCFQRSGKYPWSPMVRTKFEWRGICAENTKEDRNDE